MSLAAGGWDVSAVYEAASHERFVHRAYVVLEQPKELSYSLSYLFSRKESAEKQFQEAWDKVKNLLEEGNGSL